MGMVQIGGNYDIIHPVVCIVITDHIYIYIAKILPGMIVTS